MNVRPVFFRSPDDDGAPLDYSYVPSVSEGRRRQQEQAIHQKDSPSAPIVRHRAAPYERDAVDIYGTRARRTPAEPEASTRRTVMKKLPSAADGPAPAQSIAYPEDYAIPDNPFDPPPEAPRPPRRTRSARPASQTAEGAGRPESDGTSPAAQAGVPAATTVNAPGTGARIAVPADSPVMVTEDGSRYEPPARPDMPEWLRVAQQNNLPLRRPEGPRVQAAPPSQEAPAPTDLLGRPLRRRTPAQPRPSGPLPQTMADYEQAGYPRQLLQEQLQLERRQAEQPVHRRHGAQYAVSRQREAAKSESAPPPTSRRSYPPDRAQWERREARSSAPIQETAQPAPQADRAQAYAAARFEPADTRPVRAYAARLGYGDLDVPLPDPSAPLEPDQGWHVEAEEEQEPHRARISIPWLGIAAFACVFAAIGLWIARMSMDRQTKQVLAARAAQEEAIREAHPLRYEELIEEKAGKYNLSPAFVAAIVLNESSFRPDAESSVGARGLMQLMEDTAGWIYEKMGGSGAYSFDSMYDAETNVEYGCWYLNFLSERFRGDPVLVAASFHAGQGEVQNWLNDSRYSQDGLTIALENMIDGPTKQYATRVLNDYAAYKRIYYEATEDDA